MKKLRQSIVFSCIALSVSLSSSVFAANTIQNIAPAQSMFHFPNGLNLTRADIIALAPYFENSQPTVAHSAQEREKLFLAAFNSLTVDASGAAKATHLLTLIHTQPSLAKTYLPNVESPERFGAEAVEMYKTGHILAVKDAITAHQTNDKQRYNLAVAKNILACQYLTYRFAAGHIRTPRVELPSHITPPVVGDWLSGYMHDEENTYGIVVHNQRGNNWIAYGENQINKANSMAESILDEAKKTSYAEILKAFLSGIAPTEDTISKLIPFADETGNASNKDISPLFYWDETSQKLMRRENMTNVNDRHWISDWWGWTTLAELERERGLSKEAQHAIVAAGYKTEALKYGIIIDKNIK